MKPENAGDPTLTKATHASLHWTRVVNQRRAINEVFWFPSLLRRPQ